MKLGGSRSRAALKGSWSAAHPQDPDVWYAAGLPTPGWTAVPTTPDPDRRADTW